MGEFHVNLYFASNRGFLEKNVARGANSLMLFGACEG